MTTHNTAAGSFLPAGGHKVGQSSKTAVELFCSHPPLCCFQLFHSGLSLKNGCSSNITLILDKSIFLAVRIRPHTHAVAISPKRPAIACSIGSTHNNLNNPRSEIEHTTRHVLFCVSYVPVLSPSRLDCVSVPTLFEHHTVPSLCFLSRSAYARTK